jgi:hypothetical protein
LDEEDFDERRLINKRKDAILREWERDDDEVDEKTITDMNDGSHTVNKRKKGKVKTTRKTNIINTNSSNK